MAGDGRGNFHSGGKYAIAKGPESVAIGDLNGDGNPTWSARTGSPSTRIALLRSARQENSVFS